MKFSLTPDQQQQIKTFIPLFQNSIGEVAEAASRIDHAAGRLSETDAELADLVNIETLDDKKIARRLVLVEKKRLLLAFMPTVEESASARKRTVVTQSHEASELFRRACYHTAETRSRELFVASLPQAIKNDQHLAHDAWNRLARRELGMVFNPPPIDPHDDAQSIVDEAQRRLALLSDAARGADIPLPVEETSRAA